MTYKEAIERIEHRYMTVSMCINSEECRAENEAIDMAVSAMEKQIPKKPTKNGGLEEDIKIGNAIFKKGTSVLSKCPDCGEWLRPMQKYCSDCGKSIDWSDEE